MKVTAALMMMAMFAITGTESDHSFSVLDPGPVLVDPGPVIVQDRQTVLERPVVPGQSLAPAQVPNSNENPIVLDHNFSGPTLDPIPLPPANAIEPCDDCVRCECVTCCKPKRPCKIETTFCLVDPCGCEYETCVRVPACCVDEAPQINWERRLLGRQVAILCWECCDHEVKVIITRRGKVKVRD